ncbi:hypothetical protein Csa_023297 [Cucumis sativus]|nr:hypothetical protein Csa_023297 [Cucumis sativus]
MNNIVYLRIREIVSIFWWFHDENAIKTIVFSGRNTILDVELNALKIYKVDSNDLSSATSLYILHETYANMASVIPLPHFVSPLY